MKRTRRNMWISKRPPDYLYIVLKNGKQLKTAQIVILEDFEVLAAELWKYRFDVYKFK